MRDYRQQRKALIKARARGAAATEWLKTNKLTKETQAEFNALMKLTDKEFENSDHR